MINFVTGTKLLALLTFVLLPLGGGAANAASEWAKSYSAKARLVAALAKGEKSENNYLAGVHVKLEPGWKTYWRMPGDAGIPPGFDWSKSANLQSAKVLYPAPYRLKEDMGDSIVYKDEVVFPVVVSPKDPTKPVTLALNFSYGICSDICVPAEANLSLEITQNASGDAATNNLVKSYLNKVPARLSAGEKSAPFVQDVSALLSKEKPHLRIEAKFEKDAADRDLFVEVDPDFYIPMAKLESEQANGLTTYRVDLSDTEEPQRLVGQKIVLTLVSDKGQSETTVEIKKP